MWNSCGRKRNTSFKFLHGTWSYHMIFTPNITLAPEKGTKNNTKTMTARCKEAGMCWQEPYVLENKSDSTSAAKQKRSVWSLFPWVVTSLEYRWTQELCSFILLLLQAARNERTKVSPLRTRCPSTQLFHTPISWHVNMYCICEMACECRLEFSVSQALTSGHFCIFL